MRCAPGEDGTNGFFVSCFVRKATPPTGEATPTMLGSKRKAQVELVDQDDINASMIERKEGDRVEKKRKKKKKKKKHKDAFT